MVREEEVLLSDPETLLEDVEDEDEDDDGPPPGFDSIAINSKLEKMVVEDCGGEEDEDDGPPPGFSEPHPPQVLPPPPPPISHSVSDTRMLRNQELPDVQIGRKQYEDRPPMGWHSAGSKQPHTCMRASSGLFSDIQMAKNQRIDDGPPQPPGWQLNPQQQRPPESTPLLVPQSAPSSNIQTGVTQEDDDGPPPGWQLISSQQKPPLLPQSLAPSAIVDTEKRIKVGSIGETERQLSSTDCSCTPEHPSKAAPPLCSSSSVGSSDIEMASKPRSIKNEDKRLRTDKGPMQPLAAQLPPSLVPTSSEVGQLVCGTCRQLLSYPQGSKWVQCSACRTVNLVLEAHEVGQVKCGGCTVLLMYPYGAPSVKCSSCHFTTRIGAHNRRPHLAAQQARRLRHPPHQRR